jgi:hypothetical protein
MSIELFAYFTAYKMGKDVNDVEPRKGDPAIVFELLWDWAARFSGHAPERELMREIPYDHAYADAADAWLQELAFSADSNDEPDLDYKTGRVIFERLLQSMTTVVANQAVGEKLILPRSELTRRDQEMAMAMLWLHQMDLPFPINATVTLPPRPDPVPAEKNSPSSGGLLDSLLKGFRSGWHGK